MRDLLELVFEYRRLVEHSEAESTSLEPERRNRLVALENLFGQEPEALGRQDDSEYTRRHARCELRRPATLRVKGRVQSVSLVNLGGGGVCVSPAPNVPVGETALLRMVAEDQSVVYEYKVRASWLQRTLEESSMGMPFDGVPRAIEGAALTPTAIL